jgi:hypothetical protein
MNERDEFNAAYAAAVDRGWDNVKNLSWQIWQAARAKPVVPDGWVMVPVEPTEAIRDAMYTSGYEAADSLLNYTYKAMLAAAPKQGDV